MFTLINSLIRICFFTIVFSLFLYGTPSCTTVSSERVDKRLMPYVEKFLSLCKSYDYDCSEWKKVSMQITPIGKDFIDKILPTKGSTIGRCNMVYQRITIDSDFFKRATHSEIEATVIHELGHCLFMRKHTEDHLSIMNPYSMEDMLYVHLYQQFMDEFFECEKNCPKVSFNKERYGEKNE
jgi:hypothetical protein